MTGKGKVNLQLRFDGEDPVVQRALSILDFLPKKKNYAILIALDEFFQKYGLYEMDETAVKNFMCNYQYIRSIYQQFQPLLGSDRPIRASAENTQHTFTKREVKKPNNALKSTIADAPTAPVSSKIAETSPLNPAPSGVTSADESSVHFAGDPVIGNKQRNKMRNMLELFEV